MIVKQGNNWLSAKLNDEVVMMNPESEIYIGLNEIGTIIWDMIESPCSFEAILAQITSQYDAPEAVIRQDVMTFLEEMAGSGAVVLETVDRSADTKS